MSIKVAIIGAGSVVFSKNITGDILGFPEFRDATFSYMDIDPDRLEVGAALCRKAAAALGARPTIHATLDRRQALAGADFVINMVQIGGFNSTLIDFEIPRKYGLNFTIADTTGPGGLFRALRTFPMLKGLCEDMHAVCPDAVLLNYSNPMSMNMQTIYRAGGLGPGKAVGLCHSVQGTYDALMRYIGEDPHDPSLGFVCAGINHMAFYLRLEKHGKDLYPRLFEAMNDPRKFASNRVRFELMKRLGFFVTESSEHNAEYCPYFIPHGPDAVARFGVPLDEYLRRCDGIVEEFERMKRMSRTDAPMQVHRSHEYGSLIVHSICTGTPRVVYGNMPNRGAIASLPDTAIAEAPTLVDRAGMRFTTVGELPPQLVGYMQPHVTQHELFIRAAMEGRRDHVYQACMFDPLTAATLPLDKIVEMCDEMIECHRADLPDLDAKMTLVPASGKTFAPTRAEDLRASWDAAQARKGQDAVRHWHVIGPFTGPERQQISLDLATELERQFLARGDGSVDLSATYTPNGSTLAWKPVEASPRRKGYLNFDDELGRHEYCVAYAYTQIEEVHGRETVLRCGSDDGIRIWLNGRMVHNHEVQRGYTPDADEVTVRLEPGVNRILVKIDNYVAGWGFGMSIPRATF